MNTNKCLATQRDKPSTPILVDCNPDSVYQQWTMASKFKWQAGGDEPPNDSEDMWTTFCGQEQWLKLKAMIRSTGERWPKIKTPVWTAHDSWLLCDKYASKREKFLLSAHAWSLIHLPLLRPKNPASLSLSTTYFLCMLMPSKLWSVPRSGVEEHSPE